MLGATLLALSILFQLGTVYFVLRMIPLSKGRLAWILIAAALFARTVRHLIQFGLILNGAIPLPSSLDEGLSCLASLLLLAGLKAVAPLFTAFRQSEKQLEESLAQAQRLQKAAQDADRAKDEFLAGVSHELRTPLTVLIGALDLADDPAGGPHPQVMKMAREAAGVLRRLIEDLLDSARIGAGRMMFVSEPFSPRECLEGAVRQFRTVASDKGLRLESHVSSRVPGYLLGDGERVTQVLRNLVDNAVKFTEAGRIDVRLNEAGTPPDGGIRGIHFQVADTGCGIPEEQIGKVFGNFYQSDMSPTRLYRGMGLGLGLSQALVEGMGGRIWIETSGPGGTTVGFVLPCERAEPS